MIFFDAETKVLDTEIFPPHSITDLNSDITFYCLVYSGEAFTVKRHTHTYTLTAEFWGNLLIYLWFYMKITYY